MDLNAVEEVLLPARRDELPRWQPGDAVIAGGTWLFSEAQDTVRRLVDVTALAWPAATVTDDGVELAATCTVAEVSDLGGQLEGRWPAAALMHQCARALVASFKVWSAATVGGNLCLAFPAGAMISLTAALDATVTVWRPDGSHYLVAVTDLVTGASQTVLADGDIVRSVHLPAAALRADTAFRKIALSALGRSGAVVIGRRDHAADGGRCVLTVTGAVTRPVQLRFDRVPAPAELDLALAGIDPALWYDDAHGEPAWRRAVSAVLAHEIVDELR